jgi:hypothetical protein
MKTNAERTVPVQHSRGWNDKKLGQALKKAARQERASEAHTARQMAQAMGTETGSIQNSA